MLRKCILLILNEFKYLRCIRKSKLDDLLEIWCWISDSPQSFEFLDYSRMLRELLLIFIECESEDVNTMAIIANIFKGAPKQAISTAVQFMQRTNLLPLHLISQIPILSRFSNWPTILRKTVNDCFSFHNRFSLLCSSLFFLTLFNTFKFPPFGTKLLEFLLT